VLPLAEYSCQKVGDIPVAPNGGKSIGSQVMY
jgi:hypothetical protein